MERSPTMAGILLFSSLLFVGTCNGDFPSGAIQAIRCMLLQTAPEDCSSVRGVPVPPYLTAVYNDLPSDLHVALHSIELRNLSNSQIASLPLSILYLIPRARLADLTGAQLGAVLQQHADDTSLAQQISSSLQNTERLLQILNKLKVTKLSQDVQRVLGEWIHTSDLTEESLSLLPFLQEPILAYIRPSVLLQADSGNVHRVLVHMREVNKRLPTKEAVHVLAEGAIRHQYLLNKIHWLVEGLTPDEIKNESLLATPSTDSFKLDLSTLQARALFERVYQNASLHLVHFIDSKPLLSRLSPKLLQKFPDREQKYDATLPQTPLSLPTALQIREYVKADCQITGKLPKDAVDWGNRLRYLGPWVFTLPLARLEEYLDNPLNEATLQTVQSPRLSPMQAHYLTGKGSALDLSILSSVTGLFAFLHALPASQLTSRRLGEINSVLLQHLVNNLPADNLPRTLSLVHKIASSIGDQEILEGLMHNKDVNGIMSLVSPKDLQTSAPRMIRVFASNEKDFGPIVRRLPQPVLFTFLEEAQKNPKWSWHSLLDQTHIFRFLIGGLSCQHVEELDTGLFVPILAEYNRHRDQSFPKNLQHCCLQKLISHLELKMALSQAEESRGLMSILEPVEIEAVGGYVLAALPVEAMKQSPYLGNLVATIGKLSNAELMLASNLSHLQEIAKLAVDKEGKVDAFHTGNLNWFMPADASVSELRLALEAGRLDTTLCLPAESRQLIANRLRQAFGSPESWTAAVLAALQDLLIVFKEEELSLIGLDSWTEVADSLSSHYGDNVEWIQSAPFYQVCMNRLGKFEETDYKSAVALYARYLLMAAQWQLDTVHHVSQPDKQYENMIPVKHETLEQDITVRVFHPVVVEYDGEDVEDEVEGGGDGDEDYEDEEDSQDSEEQFKEVTTKKTQMEPISTEPSTIEKQDIIIDTRMKQLLTTDKAITLTTTTTIKQIPQSSESAVVLDVTERFNIHNKDLSTESTLNPINKSVIEVKGSTVHHKNETSITEDKIKNNNAVHSESDLKVDNKTNLEPDLHESKMSKSESTTATMNNTETKTTASQNFILTSSPSHINQDSSSLTVNETNDTTISKFILTSTLSFAKQTNNSLSMNETEDRTISNISNNVAERDNETATTVSPLNSLNSSSNSTSHVSASTITLLPYKINVSISESTNSPQMSNKIDKDSRENKTVNTISTENETIDDKSALNISVPIEAPVHLPKSIDGNVIEEEDSDEEYIANDEGYDDDLEGAESSNLLVDPDPSVSNTKRRKRSNEYFRYSYQLSCNALRMVGRIAGLALTDIESMSSEELNDCRQELGAMELSPQVLQQIWRKINKKEGTHLFGNLLQAAAVADLWDFSWDISKPWTLENIQALITHSNLSVVLNKLIVQVKDENTDFTPELLAVLGGFVCSLEPDSLRSLSVVGLQPLAAGHCPPCLPRLAQRAVDQLGPVSFWTQHHVQVLQYVVAGLPLSEWRTLIESPFKPLTGLQPSAIQCLNESHLQALTLTEIKQIPTLTLLALPPEELAPFNIAQLWSLGNKSLLATPSQLNPRLDIFIAGHPSGSSNLAISAYLTILTNLILIIPYVL